MKMKLPEDHQTETLLLLDMKRPNFPIYSDFLLLLKGEVEAGIMLSLFVWRLNFARLSGTPLITVRYELRKSKNPFWGYARIPFNRLRHGARILFSEGFADYEEPDPETLIIRVHLRVVVDRMTLMFEELGIDPTPARELLARGV